MIPSRYRGIENTQKEINAVLDKIRDEIEQLPMNTRTNWDGCCPDIDYPEIEYVDVTKAKLLEIIDKYRTGSNETQTNEIVYDIGGHMYGAMGGDVIMDILAGKGKE